MSGKVAVGENIRSSQPTRLFTGLVMIQKRTEEANCDRLTCLNERSRPQKEAVGLGCGKFLHPRQVVRKAVNQSIDWDPKSVASQTQDCLFSTVSYYAISTAQGSLKGHNEADLTSTISRLLLQSGNFKI